MIKVFIYYAAPVENGVVQEGPHHIHIGFCEPSLSAGAQIGFLKQSGLHWNFFAEPASGSLPLSASHLRTITDKLDSLNAQALPTKKGDFNRRHEKTQALRKEAFGSQSGD